MAKPRRPDPKIDALRRQGTLNAHPERVRDALFATSDFFDARALVPKKRGPRGAHKLSSEVVDFLLQERSEESSLGSPELARRVRERFGRKVHPRSVERALARREKKRR